MTPARVTTRTAVLSTALLALVISIPSLGHDFVYDDVWIVEDREVVHRGEIGPLLTETYWPAEREEALWRPGALLAFSAQWALGDGSPVVFHGVNTLLYALVAGLLALLAARLFTPGVGLISGLLFAAHPIHVEVTANVVGQAELLSAACYLGVLLLAWRGIQEHQPFRASIPILLGAGLLTLVGIGVKEHVVTLPGALLVLWWLAAVRKDEAVKEVAGRHWPMLVAVLIPIGLYLAARAQILGGVADSGGLAPGLDPDSPFQRLVVMLPVTLHWLRLLFWPVNLSAEYGPAHLVPHSDFGVLHGAALGLWAVLLGLAWRYRHGIPALAVGAGLFLVTVSVVSNVVVPLEILLAERLLFLPSAGWAVAMGGLGVAAWKARVRARIPVAVAVAAVTLLFAWRSLDRTPVWSDNETFFTQMERDAPRSYRMVRRTADAALAAGDTARAEEIMREAVERAPYDYRPAEDLGRMYMSAGRHEAAVPLFLHALELDMERRGPLQGLAISLTLLGRGGDALRWLDWLEELHDTGLETRVLRVQALRAAERFRESVDVAEAAIEDWPDDWTLHVMAAESARLGGLCDPALFHAEEGARKAPESRRQDLEELRDAIREDEAVCP